MLKLYPLFLPPQSFQDSHAKTLPKESFSDGDDDVPSAPPFCGSGQKINESAKQVSPSGEQSKPCAAGSHGFSTKNGPDTLRSVPGFNSEDKTGMGVPDKFVRTTASAEADVPSSSHPARLPTFHASAQGPWHAVIAYDACVRLCLHAWAGGCMDAPMFLESECALLRNAFGLQQVLLQSEEELLVKRSSELASEGTVPKPKKIIGKMKVQVRKVKMSLDPPSGCSMSSLRAPTIKLESLRYRLSNLRSTFSSGWQALRRIHVVPRIPANGSFSRKSLAYVHASSQYIKQVSGLLKTGVTTLRSSPSSYEGVQAEEDAIRMLPGSGETHVFFPDSLGDDLILEVKDSKGKYFGRVLAQVATIAEDPCGSVAETVAYDLVLEVAMKIQHFQQRNLLIHGPWKWLLTEFASYYGVSDVYTKLRYLSYVMDVATPTADCLTLVYDLLLPVIMKGHSKSTLSHQENRILGEIKDQTEQILALVFENYKSLDESSASGIIDAFRPATGLAAPVLEPAVKLYTLLHDILSPEVQNHLCHYFQAAAKKRSRRHLAETDEFVSNNSEGSILDALTVSIAYQKMKSLCLNIRNEIYTDIEIHNQHILPSFIDLPNLSSSIYSTELSSRLRAFLISCPPPGPSPPVTELVIATADFQRDLASWNINPVKGGVDAKELFHLYIVIWIQDKRLYLLESCKLDKRHMVLDSIPAIGKSLYYLEPSCGGYSQARWGLETMVKWSGVRTQHSTTPFVDDMYDRVKETLNDYEVIISRWPEYTFVLENAIADVEKSIVDALEKQYADVLLPLKENLAPKKFGLKYVQKLAKRSVCQYIVPDELGILLNSMKRMLDVLRPKIETQIKSWGSCIPDGGNTAPGERLSEVTVMLRAKFRNYLQAVVEKLAENTRLQSATKLKKILQESKETVGESDVRSRMQPLKDMLIETINHLHTVLETHVFIATCRGYWDRMGQDILSFLENRKENRSWYKGSRVAVSGPAEGRRSASDVQPFCDMQILDDIFGSQLQQLLGNALQEKDVEPPRSIMEVRSMLCKDVPNHKDNTYYY
ncbi:hypothetical protein CK203_033106 [Vitis vinifera]|uniref:Uncharacterized protein n=1 Tax=Vitis vinifera TaxID=29760 RepID=A0A438G072_VITVI|nr:hypothetical protein CK203_033106 [Vitis vinifera]